MNRRYNAFYTPSHSVEMPAPMAVAPQQPQALPRRRKDYLLIGAAAIVITSITWLIVVVAQRAMPVSIRLLKTSRVGVASTIEYVYEFHVSGPGSVSTEPLPNLDITRLTHFSLCCTQPDGHAVCSCADVKIQSALPYDTAAIAVMRVHAAGICRLVYGVHV